MRLFQSLCLAALCLLSTGQLSAVPRVFLGYYSAVGGQEVHKVPFKQLTHVSHAFLALDAEGNLLKSEGTPNNALVQTAHKNRVRVLLALGGGKTAEGLSRLSRTPDELKKLATEVVRIATQNGYDGVDLVWEFPGNKSTREGYITLLTALRQRLTESKQADGAEPYLLTAVVPASGALGRWIDVERAAPLVDWFNVAAYDMSGPWERTAGHHAPLHPSPHDPEKAWRSVSGAMAYWNRERGAPKEKLVLGLAMYGRALPVSAVHEPLDPAKREQHGALPFNRIRELIGQKWPAMWDRESEVPWLRPPAQGEPLLVCFDDRNSIHAKADWARKREYRGLYFWAIHQDRMPDGTHWLLTAAEKAWPASE